MKKIALISAIALGGLFYNNANAQILQIGLNLGGHRPMVEATLVTPNVAVTYSNADYYYYLPDVDAYYSVPDKVYYYNNGINWVPAAYLPGEYRNYNWRNARHYEVRARRPFLNGNVYRERYNGRVYDWKRYNEKVEVRRDDRFDNRNDYRDFNNRNNNRHREPQFVRPNNQPRGIEHANGRDWNNNNNNRGDRGNENRSYNQSQRHGSDHFAGNHEQGSRHGFSRS
jgi:hypothetical protein